MVVTKAVAVALVVALGPSFVLAEVGAPVWQLGSIVNTSFLSEPLKPCLGRGGCDCDCSWTGVSGACSHDDGSCCWECCCGSPAPVPPPSPGPGPTPGNATYCPNPASDFVADYVAGGGSLQWSSSGWTIHGGARASSKASFNLAGGFMEFDMDVSGAHGGVNNNAYITFPSRVGSYCDSGGTGGCAELDFAENNGNCASSSTFHTDPSGGDHDGKQSVFPIGNHIHVRASWDQAGNTLDIDVNGHHWTGNGMPDQLREHGAVLYSSQWTGWVPGQCGGDGNLAASTFSVSNLKIQGTVVQGPEPTKCVPAPTPPTPAPTVPTPTPAPSAPTPPAHGCPGGSIDACMHLCPGDDKGYKACVEECALRCESEIYV